MRTPLLVVAPLVLLAACSSGGKPAQQSLGSTPTPTTAASASRAGQRPATQTSPRPTTGTTRSTAPAGTGSSPSATSSAPAAPLSTRAPGRPAASKATPAGDYTYTSSGKVTFGASPQDASGTQTLTIGPLRGGMQHSTLHSDQSGDTEQDVLVRDAGSYGASLKLTSPAFTKEFRPATAVLLVPDPAVVGRSWSWSATSTDGRTRVSATNELLRKERLTIGGAPVDTVVLQTHLVLSGDVDYDAQITLWWAPAHRLPVKTHTVGKGSYSGIPFSTDITAVMRSVTPA